VPFINELRVIGAVFFPNGYVELVSTRSQLCLAREVVRGLKFGPWQLDEHVASGLHRFRHLAITPCLFLRWLLTDDKATIAKLFTPQFSSVLGVGRSF